MSLKENTKIVNVGGTSHYFSLSVKLKTDSAFPFDLEDEDLIMEIVEEKIIIKKGKKGEE